MDWRHRGSPRPPKFLLQKSAGKFLASIFWGQDGILLIDYFPKGQTNNAECYSSLLVQLKDILKENEAGSSQRVSCSCTTISRLTGHLQPGRNSLLGLPISWSPTLFSGSGPARLPPVPWTEKQLKGRHFSSDVEVIAAAETWLDGQPSEFFFWVACKGRAAD